MIPYKTTALLIILCSVVVSGCANKSESQHSDQQSHLDWIRLEQYRMELAERKQARTTAAVTPLVKFHFVDSGGHLQKLEINQSLQGD